MLHSIDSDGRITEVSDYWLEVLGYERSEVIGRMSVDFLVEESKKYAKKVALPEFFKTGIAREIPYQFVKKSGEIVDILLSGIPQFVEDGSFLQSLAVFVDVTERNRAENALQDALIQLKQLKNRLQAENIYLQSEIKLTHNFQEIISRSAQITKVLRKVEQVASTEATVMILGETGTGKELIARAVHNLSPRRDRPLVKENCAALPANLIESELFGHEKGAFTGALSRKIGRFELADKGTVFLDEIGDLHLELQSKLLRVLQEGEFERIGNSATTNVDVRVIAATNRDIEQAVQNGSFREDLFYRLNVFPIVIPPLRDRKEDLHVLINHFVKKFSAKTGKIIDTIPQKIINTLQRYDWQGNVRELENIIERAVIVTVGTHLELGDWLPRSGPASNSAKSHTLINELERGHILEVLKTSG